MFREGVGYSPELVARMKDTYCEGDWARCARYIAWNEISEEAVTDDLFPSDAHKLDELRRLFGG